MCQISLEIIYKNRQTSGDACATGGANSGMNMFDHGHFKLNSYLKMQVILAMEIIPRTCIKRIGNLCIDKDVEFEIKGFKPVIELIVKLIGLSTL